MGSAREIRLNNEELARLQDASADLALGPVYEAWRKVAWYGQTGRKACWIRLPFPFTDELTDWCERINELWEYWGFDLRPGGPSGPAYDIIRLVRRS